MKVEEPVKRKRGRPRKNPPQVETPKRKRGRPRKEEVSLIKEYTGDPFIVTKDGHYMDVEELKKPEHKQFKIPKNFDEFYAWRPDFVTNWVKKRLSRFNVDEEVEDWTQDLLIHLRYLSKDSKYRIPGANGVPNGCQDIIETFNPIQQYGASERRFRNYINLILANKFNTVKKRSQNNPVCRPGNTPFGVSTDEESDHVNGEESIYANSEILSNITMRIAKQHEDRLFTNQFKEFVIANDPTVYSALEALESTRTIGEAASFLGVSNGEFNRFRNRLKQLGESFTNSCPTPSRRQYRKRNTSPSLVTD